MPFSAYTAVSPVPYTFDAASARAATAVEERVVVTMSTLWNEDAANL
jgi:hypothetical protein